MLKKQELSKLEKELIKGLTIVPYRVVQNDKGKIKVTMALARRNKNYDKKQKIKEIGKQTIWRFYYSFDKNLHISSDFDLIIRLSEFCYFDFIDDAQVRNQLQQILSETEEDLELKLKANWNDNFWETEQD